MTGARWPVASWCMERRCSTCRTPLGPDAPTGRPAKYWSYVCARQAEYAADRRRRALGRAIRLMCARTEALEAEAAQTVFSTEAEVIATLQRSAVTFED